MLNNLHIYTKEDDVVEVKVKVKSHPLLSKFVIPWNSIYVYAEEDIGKSLKKICFGY